MEREVLFKTVHGSRLYNLHHGNSDYDYFTVVTKSSKTTAHTRKRYAKQTIVEGEDSVVVDLGTFLEGCKRGVPQYCEAMFSQVATVDKISDLRKSFVMVSDSWDRYLRTIKSFSYSEKDAFKRKRHALRLAYNFKDIRRMGRFNPTMSDDLVEVVTSVAKFDSDFVYSTAMEVAWSC